MSYRPLIVVPFYNHLSCFSKIADDLAAQSYPVLLVNDGSTPEDTAGVRTICKKLGFHYLENAQNEGKGAAVLAGFTYAIQNGYTHVVQVDSDGQHNYADIGKFIARSQSNPTALINGCPVYDRTIPKSRLYGRKITKFWVWIETGGADISDTMCGFRVYPLMQIKPILPHIHFKRMGFDIEMVVKIYLNDIQIINEPTAVTYPESGVSHFRAVRDNIEISLMHTTLCCYALCKKMRRK